MSFFKKLVPGKGGEKDNGDGKRPPTDPGLSKEAAAKAPPKPSPFRDPASQVKRTPPGVPDAEVAARMAGSHEAFKREMDQLVGEEAAREAEAQMTHPEEYGTKVRSVDRQQELSTTQDGDMLELLSEQAGLNYVRLGDVPKNRITPELLRMIPSEIARSYKVFPIDLRDDSTIVVAISDPLNVRIVDDLQLFLMDQNVHKVEAVVANEEEIIDYINLYYGVGDKTLDEMVSEFEKDDVADVLMRAEGALDLSDVEKISGEAPVIRFCSLLLLQAIKDRASDLHIEPFSNVLRIRYRVDGVLREIPSPPKSWQLGILSRFKVIAGLDISETRRPQDGRIKLTIEGREIDMRVSTLPVVYGECIVMRILDKTMMMIGVQQIGMTPDVLESFMKIVERPNGILLVTGPTGSGKTTTLYAALNEINDPTEKIITTEDPVEYQLDGIVQVNINTGVGLTFARCLRAILRQDPDVILVGEIRDVETAQIAIQASLTGHLVFSTLHTNSAAGTITRLIDMGVEPFLITSTLEGCIAQRLVRVICTRCRQPYRPSDEELTEFGTTRDEVSDITFFKGAGCEECSHTGYKGRIGIFELMRITDELRNLILERATTDEVQIVALQQGMKTMRQDGWLKICLGVTTFEEVARHTPRESAALIREEMQDMLRETIGQVAPEKVQKQVMPMSSLATPQDSELAMRPRDVGDAQPAPPAPNAPPPEDPTGPSGQSS
jgi:type IV pilus assembly protein PilB